MSGPGDKGGTGDGNVAATSLSRRTTLAMLSSTAMLAACGGGGGNGGGGGAPAPTPTPTPSPTPTPTPAPTAAGPAWFGYGRDAQHTAQSAVASQDLGHIAWQTPVDTAPPYTSSGALLAHYGSPVVTIFNTVILPVKTSAAGAFKVEARKGLDGTLAWSAAIDYAAPPHNWYPPCNIVLTPQGRLCAPGAGGKVLTRADAESAGVAFVPQVFYGAAAYNANAAAFDAAVFINTPITADAQGNLFFGFQVTGTNPANLVSGIARLAPDGSGTWVGAAAAAGDSTIDKPAMNCAPALSPDGSTVYIAVNKNAGTQPGYLLALNSTNLSTRAKAALVDPGSGAPARIADNGTSSPLVGPDGRVYYGVLEQTFGSHNGRGWLLQFDAILNEIPVPGSFGWDVTPSLVPASMVPSYTGSSGYLLALKYNNYVGAGTGNGLNQLAVIDPRATQSDTITPGVTVMREVLKILAPTHDFWTADSRKEWCINTMAVDVARKSVLANNEDGMMYRWDLTTNTLSQALKLTNGLGQAYTPTLVGADGAVYAINNAILFAIRA